MQNVSLLLAICAVLASATPSPTAAPDAGRAASPLHKRSQLDARNNQIISIPLVRRSRPRPFRKGKLSSKELADIDYVTDVAALQASRDALIEKYAETRGADVVKRLQEKREAEESALNGKRDIKTIQMANHQFDTTYSAVVSLGTPPKPFNLLLDTGSSGSVSGRTGSDVVELGGYTINDQVIGIVDQAQRAMPGSVEGLMGFAFGTISKAGGTPWWLRVIAGDANDTGGTPDGRVMSFWFSRYIDSADSAEIHPGGQFTIGGTNSSLYTGDINYIDVIQPAKWWLIPIQSAGIENGPSVSVTEGRQNAIIDTGTTLVGGEDIVLDAIYANITGAIKGGELTIRLTGFWTLPCDTTAVVTLTFGGVTYTYSAVDLLYQRIDDIKPNYCLSSLFVFSSADPHSLYYTPNGSPYWIVGDAFLKNVYSVYSLGSGGSGDAGVQGMGNNGATAQVGFAKLSNVSGEIGSTGNTTTTTLTGTTTTRGPRPASTDLPVGVIPDVDTTIVVVVTATPDATQPAPSSAFATAGIATSFALVSTLGAMVLLFL
ncbi:related to aspartic peptidase A1-Laccaria bicolor [Serendipita indica DSM 11827]|uniref:Related to aspartic peptidase A1-Laccaria bicolor n=1 Tax=Serendipita indica (strain DSM 11827) TaxID=1109443 RepID=G4TZ02_SERID|nr:related to aspartic peptidase A1-Laccaria bicolor [Serendipita indica DSM 11827]